MKFELNEKQVIKLNEWKEAIYKIYGDYGYFTYKFTPCGPGITVSVYSDIARVELDLIDVESW